MRNRLPEWLSVELPSGEGYLRTRGLLRNCGLRTVCEEAHCPNMCECFSRGTATFLVMGPRCTRDCRYCDIEHGVPHMLDKNEPMQLAEAVKKLGLRHVVVTSVTRDDLPDGGASHFAEVVNSIRQMNLSTTIELLVPDFQGSQAAVEIIITASPDVINHNIETIERLFDIRPGANYNRSLKLLRSFADAGLITKSGVMLGLGESKEETLVTLQDLKKIGVSIVTLGQYLQPNGGAIPVEKFYTPEEFKEFKELALDMGFKHVESGPLVRSSYHAEDAL
jgi:lipoyl synthase